MPTETTPILRTGPAYWTALCVASVFGAQAGDTLAHTLHLGHWRGLLPLALLFWLIRAAERRRRPGAVAARLCCFWLSVVLVRIAATNIADLADHDLHLGPMALSAGIAALLLGTLLTRPGSSPAASGATPVQDGRFWLALFLAGTLGTVLGDSASHAIGVAAASGVLSAGLALILVARRCDPYGGSASYWTAVLGARTAGTSVGDLMADRLGLLPATLASGLLMVVAIGLAYCSGSTGSAQSRPPFSTGALRPRGRRSGERLPTSRS